MALQMNERLWCEREEFSKEARILVLTSSFASEEQAFRSSTQSSMARSFTNVKVLSALVADGFSNTTTRGNLAVTGGEMKDKELVKWHGFAAAAAATQSATRGGASIGGNMVPKSGEEKVRGGEKVSWVPDPVTGYYRPENTNEIDVADMRATNLFGQLYVRCISKFTEASGIIKYEAIFYISFVLRTPNYAFAVFSLENNRSSL
ncbi:hypothetical protein V8G54_028009 [Vigna mungo]|uniref:Uncharacterized protein n=1 Tax=Vigna mungo TaxID=3915 RepID=A0AAQ3MRX6_VIGMU